LFKKILFASAIAIMSWQDVTWSSLCTGVKECGTKRAHNFLFPKSSFRIQRTIVLGTLKILLSFLMRFYGHFWPNSNSSSVHLSSSRCWTATSLVVFYKLPSILKSRIPPQNVSSVHSLIPISLLHQYECFCHWQTSFETKFYGNSLFISTIHDEWRKLTFQDKL
jgi:hypothetical protein